uniref:Uncharacterized protein n=1 Tax=Ditylenchus dipsaci TaxID=166011 RepID=A0A915EKT1_9BILA
MLHLLLGLAMLQLPAYCPQQELEIVRTPFHSLYTNKWGSSILGWLIHWFPLPLFPAVGWLLLTSSSVEIVKKCYYPFSINFFLLLFSVWYVGGGGPEIIFPLLERKSLAGWQVSTLAGWICLPTCRSTLSFGCALDIHTTTARDGDQCDLRLLHKLLLE